jgi:predicted permease
MRHRLSRLLYRSLLRLAPRHLRESHGREMEHLFVEALHLEVDRRGWTAYPYAWWNAVRDTVALRLEQRGNSPRIEVPRPRKRSRIESAGESVRLAARSLRRDPWFTAIAVLTLTLGIGVNTAIFAVANGVLLRPLPYPSPDAVLTVWESNPEKGTSQSLVSPPTYYDLRKNTSALSNVAAFSDDVLELTGGVQPERINAVMASPGIFSLLGVHLAEGNEFPPDADEPGRHRVVVLGFDFWQRWFGGDRQAIGSTITLDNETYRVTGVLPEDFWFPDQADLWAPLSFSPAELTEGMRGARYLRVLARLSPGFSVEQARSEATAIGRQLGVLHPNNAGWKFELRSLQDHLLGQYRQPLLALMVAVGFVLCIACANVANLVLARSSERQRESAVRAALGASRMHLVRAALTENMLLALAGGIAGAIAAAWTIAPITRLAPAAIPRLDEVALDADVVLFCLALSVVTGLVLTTVSQLGARDRHEDEALRVAGGTTGVRARLRMRSGLIVAEVALSLVLLIGAALMVRSFVTLNRVDPGFSTGGVMTASLSLPKTRYGTKAEQRTFYKELNARLNALSSVQAVGATTNLPMSGSSMNFGFAIEGVSEETVGARLVAEYHASSPGYFRAMEIDLRGRPFRASDDENAPQIVIINESMARRFWPQQEAIGKRLTVVSQDGPVSREIVGIVADVRHRGLASQPRWEVYVPLAQDPWPFVAVAIRTTQGELPLGPMVRDQLALLDPVLPLNSLLPIERLVARWHAPLRFQLLLVALFAGLALTLAALGIYGVISYVVARRTNEIGIRIALGAGLASIFGTVVRRGFSLVMAGVAIGTVGALWLTRYLSSLLYEISATDPLTFAGVAVLVAAVASAACSVPALRATRVDPVTALRRE